MVRLGEEFPAVVGIVFESELLTYQCQLVAT